MENAYLNVDQSVHTIAVWSSDSHPFTYALVI